MLYNTTRVHRTIDLGIETTKAGFIIYYTQHQRRGLLWLNLQMKIYYIVRYERQYDNVYRVMYDPNDNRIIYLLCVRSNIIRADTLSVERVVIILLYTFCRRKKENHIYTRFLNVSGGSLPIGLTSNIYIKIILVKLFF